VRHVRRFGSRQTIQIVPKALLGGLRVPTGFPVELTTRPQPLQEDVHPLPDTQGLVIDHLTRAALVGQTRQPGAEGREEMTDRSGDLLGKNRQRFYR
jgi:hypothetical protein